MEPAFAADRTTRNFDLDVVIACVLRLPGCEVVLARHRDDIELAGRSWSGEAGERNGPGQHERSAHCVEATAHPGQEVGPGAHRLRECDAEGGWDASRRAESVRPGLDCPRQARAFLDGACRVEFAGEPGTADHLECQPSGA